MTGAGSVYGEALYDLAKAEGLSADFLQQLQVLAKSFEAEPDFLRLMSAPSLNKQERCAVLDESLGGRVHPYVLNFLKILTEKGYARQFPECVKAYREHYNADNGILPVTAVTAVALSEKQAQRLTEKLSQLTEKTVELTNRIDTSVLGGIRLQYSGKQLDDTVQHRLAAIRDTLKNTVL